jgi:hypothetical protein
LLTLQERHYKNPKFEKKGNDLHTEKEVNQEKREI